MQRNISEIAKELGIPAPSRNDVITTLLTDSRELEEGRGTLFFAIATSGNDGHRYIGELLGRGVRNFVVTHVPEEYAEADAAFLVVPDVVKALQRIGRRDGHFPGHLLGVTGSRGKTTLKEWIFQLMEPLGDVSRSPRSYNSQIGVPLSMWSLEPQAPLGIIEAGISRRGEMEALAECIAPDTVIVTNVGDAHAEGFANVAEKAREKMRLAKHPDVKSLIYRLGDENIEAAADALGVTARRIRWSYDNPEAELYIRRERENDLARLRYAFEGKENELAAPLESEADFENAAAALAFMLLRGVAPEAIAERFRHLHKIGTRLNVTEGVNGSVLIEDSYTSDFSSLRPALHFARRRQPAGHGLTLILSDLHHENPDLEEMLSLIHISEPTRPY